MSDRIERVWPIPEALANEDWHVHVGAGGVDYAAGDMTIPIGPTVEDLSTRNHEMCHAAFTPVSATIPQNWGVSERALQVCEDLRVQRNGARRGVKFYSHRERDVEMFRNRLATCESAADAQRLAAYVWVSTNMWEPHGVEQVRQAIPSRYMATAERALAGVQAIFDAKGDTEFGASVEAAKWLDQTLGVMADPEGTEALMGGFPNDPQARWGHLKQIRVPLRRPLNTKGRAKAYRTRCVEEGTIPSRLHRLPIDQQVFGQKVGVPGGTILVDRSGSMAMKASELLELLHERPRLTVADYGGGYSSDSEDQSGGELRILVRHGRIAAPAIIAHAPGAGANVIDGPALKWLARMPRPRIWISDGFVTGIDEHCSVFLAQDAISIKKNAGIVRYQNLATFKRGIPAPPVGADHAMWEGI